MIRTQAELDAAVADAHALGLHAEVIDTTDGPTLMTFHHAADAELSRRFYANGIRHAAPATPGSAA